MEKKFIDYSSENEYKLEIKLYYSDHSISDEDENYIHDAAERIVDSYERHKANFKSLHLFLEHVEIIDANFEEILLIFKQVKILLKNKKIK